MLVEKLASRSAAQGLQINSSGLTRLAAIWHDALTFRSDATFSAALAVIWTVFYNTAFWKHTFTAMWDPTLGGVVFMASLFILVFTVHATLLLLVPVRALRWVVAALFIIASLTTYFCNTYGVVMNKDMMRNVLQTDVAEMGGLMSPGLMLHLLLLGVLPALLVQHVSWPHRHWRLRLRKRALLALSAWCISIAGMLAVSSSYAVFLREHKPLRFMLIPAAPLLNALALLGANAEPGRGAALLNPAGNTQLVEPHSSRPRVVFLVVGETARAANFSLGGYARDTNPALQSVANLVYFDHASSCGTATAISVPCMFSPLGKRAFKVAKAGQYVNLLDSVSAAGVTVEWHDNNAGCKGVCARIPVITYTRHSDPQWCSQSYCYDEILLRDLERRLQKIDRDTLIVFHQIGSHGPAYSERYPPNFAKFKPACASHELQKCSPEEVRNAYDNSIAYTDHILARQISLLQATRNIDAMLIYASDHGESLGEHGVYLHGMPYAFAPREQTSVPMLIWTSGSMRDRLALDAGCLARSRHAPVSHDNVYHTLLGALGLRNDAYRQELDLLALCRSGGVSRARV